MQRRSNLLRREHKQWGQYLYDERKLMLMLVAGRHLIITNASLHSS